MPGRNKALMGSCQFMFSFLSFAQGGEVTPCKADSAMPQRRDKKRRPEWRELVWIEETLRGPGTGLSTNLEYQYLLSRDPLPPSQRVFLTKFTVHKRVSNHFLRGSLDPIVRL